MNKTLTQPAIVAATLIEAVGAQIGDPLMTAQQLQLLLQLWIHGELAQVDLPKYTKVERSANSRNIAKLGQGEKPIEKRGPGWVEAYEDPENRRFKRVRLTPLGRASMDKAVQEAARYE
jgi:DNA-binding MarR family transcriptional regulator